jgi:hypothetical protein
MINRRARRPRREISGMQRMPTHGGADRIDMSGGLTCLCCHQNIQRWQRTPGYEELSEALKNVRWAERAERHDSAAGAPR